MTTNPCADIEALDLYPSVERFVRLPSRTTVLVSAGGAARTWTKQQDGTWRGSMGQHITALQLAQRCENAAKWRVL